MWQLIQPDDPAPDPPANGPGERSATGDSTAASILDRPAPWVSEVWLDGSARLAEVAWVDAGPGRDAPGGIDGAVCSLLDEQGPWAGVLAIGSQWLHEMGEKLYVLTRAKPFEAPEPEVVMLTDADDMDDVEGWERVEWAEVQRRAQASPRWSRWVAA
jgi:hypothetical protein